MGGDYRVAAAAGVLFHILVACTLPWAVGVAIASLSAVGITKSMARSDQHQRNTKDDQILKHRS